MAGVEFFCLKFAVLALQRRKVARRLENLGKFSSPLMLKDVYEGSPSKTTEPIFPVKADLRLRGARGAEGSGPPLSCKFLVRCDRDRSIFWAFDTLSIDTLCFSDDLFREFFATFFREFFDDQRIFLTTRGDSWVAFGLKNDFSGG